MALPASWTFIEAAEATQVLKVNSTDGGPVNIEATTKAAVINNTAYPIPGDIPVGAGKCLMYVLCTNPTTEDYVIGVKWKVYDPEGTLVENLEIGPPSGIPYLSNWTPKNGGTKEFISTVGFTPTLEGTYTWNMEFFGRTVNQFSLYTLHTYSFSFNGIAYTDPMLEMMYMMMTMMMLGMMMSMMKGMMPEDNNDKGGKKFKNPEGPKLPPVNTGEKEVEKTTETTPQLTTAQQSLAQPPAVKRRIIEEY